VRAYFVGAKGGKPVIEAHDVPQPVPAADEVLVRVRAAALNRGEFIVGHGLVHGTADAAATPFGLEAAGEVVALGANVSGIEPGARIMGRVRTGFAEYAVADVREIIPAPTALSWEQAGGVPIAFLTAYDMLVESGDLAAGEWVLITGASSGVGVATLQMAKALGANVIGTSGSPQKLAALQELGLDIGITTRAAPPKGKIAEATKGHGVDLVINNVGGTVFEECLAMLAYRGRLATVGYVDGSMEARVDLSLIHQQRLRVFGVSNKLRTADERAVSAAGFIRDILPLLASGRIRPVVDKVFAFDELEQAKDYMLSDAQIGKIVLRL